MNSSSAGLSRYPISLTLMGILLDHFRDGMVVKFIYLAERKLIECHTVYPVVNLCKVCLQPVQDFLGCAHEEHPVFLCLDKVHEYLATAVLLMPDVADPFHIERNIAAVANGEY